MGRPGVFYNLWQRFLNLAPMIVLAVFTIILLQFSGRIYHIFKLPPRDDQRNYVRIRSDDRLDALVMSHAVDRSSFQIELHVASVDSNLISAESLNEVKILSSPEWPPITIDVDGKRNTFIVNPASYSTQSLQEDALITSDPGNPRFKIRSCTAPVGGSKGRQNIIPKIIHQTWKTHDTPASFHKWQSTWKLHHADWKYKFWSDADNFELVNSSFPWFLDTYQSFPKNIMRVDAVRYMYMYKYGGFYADLDFECLASHFPLTYCGSVLLPLLGSDYKHPHNIPNAWLASVAGHPFWIFVLREIMTRWSASTQSPDMYVEAVAGPCLLHHAASLYAKEYKNTPTSLPVRYVEEGLIFPFDWRKRYKDPLVSRRCGGVKGQGRNETECKSLLDVSQAYAITYWSHTWG